MSSLKEKRPDFSGKASDFPSFKDDFEAWLIVQDMFELLSMQESKLSEEQKKLNVKLWAHLKLAVDPKTKVIVGNVPNKNGIGAWKAVVKKWAGMEKLDLLNLKNELEDLRVRGEDVEVYLEQFSAITKRLAEAGKPVPEQEQVDLILRRLPNSYEEFVLSCLKTTELPLEQLVTDICALDRNRRARSNNVVPEYGAKAEGFKKKNKAEDGMKRKVKCFKCGQLGHIKLNCPNKFGSGKSSAKSTEEAKLIGERSLKLEWRLDSCCTSHMQPGFEGVHGAVMSSTSIDGAFATGKSTHEGKRNLYLLGTSGRPVCISLPRILVVDGLRDPLLSLSKLLKDGWDVSFDKAGALLTKEKDSIMFRQVGDTYRAVECTPDEAKVSKEHEMFGHASDKVISKTLGREVPKSGTCDSCLSMKAKRICFAGDTVTKEAGARVFMDLMGPLKQPFHHSGIRYGCFIVDGYSRFGYVDMIPRKSAKEVLGCLKRYCSKYGTPKAIRTDNGSEYLNYDMNEFCTERVINHETTAPYSPQQNSVAESCIRESTRMARAMLKSSGLGPEFFGFALIHAVYVRNRLSWYEGKSPFEFMFGMKPDLTLIRKFGSLVFALNEGHLTKQEERSMKMIYLGVKNESSGALRLWNPETSRVIESRNVYFNEDSSSEDFNKANQDLDD
jgi:hypothetical protein